MNHVLDACAMIAFLRGESGADVVSEILRDPTSRCFAHAVNLCEVYYDFLRASNTKTARSAIKDLFAIGVLARRDMNTPFWMGVGTLKGTIRRISLADCFAIQLSRGILMDKLSQAIITSLILYSHNASAACGFIR